MRMDNRFVIVSKEGSMWKEEGVRWIMVDRETGVNYIVWKSGYAGGMTPILDENGKPVVTKTF